MNPKKEPLWSLRVGLRVQGSGRVTREKGSNSWFLLKGSTGFTAVTMGSLIYRGLHK